MILLDTNVVSELMRAAPARAVVDWLDAQPAETVWISAITIAEIRLGLARLPAGKRREALTVLADAMIDEDFAAACLPFDRAAAGHYATIVADRLKRGRPISVEDAQIAAIARAADLTLATRNLEDFAAIDGLALANPWQA